jgi:curved DNA-binding protein CbpA
MRDEPDYYAILGVPSTISMDELRLRHRILVRLLHPDLHAGDPAFEERLTLINAAFHELRDVRRRYAYDIRRRQSVMQGRRAYRFIGEAQPLVFSSRLDDVRRDGYSFRAGTIPSVKHKTSVLVGAILTATAAALVFASVWMVAMGDNPPSSTNYQSRLSNAAVAGEPLTDDQLRRACNVAQGNYEEKFVSLISEEQSTVTDGWTMANALQGEGNSSAADTLRRECASFQSGLLAAGDGVRHLGDMKSIAAETQLEQDLNVRFSRLQGADARLSLKLQSLKDGSLSSSSIVLLDESSHDKSQGQLRD